jgi:chromosome segregation ATPase
MTTLVPTQPGHSHESASDAGNVPSSPKVSSANRARALSIARVVRDFRSFLRECVLMVMDEGLKFDDLKPSLELYLRNIGFVGGADLLAEYSARLAEVEEDLDYWEGLRAVHLPSIIEAKVKQALQEKEVEVAKSTETMEAITKSIGEARTQQARINVELAEATRVARDQVAIMDRMRGIIAEAQKTLSDTEAAHAQTTKNIADMETRCGALLEQVETRTSDLKEVEAHAREVLAVTDGEVRARAEREAEEQQKTALQEIEEKLRSLE